MLKKVVGYILIVLLFAGSICGIVFGIKFANLQKDYNQIDVTEKVELQETINTLQAQLALKQSELESLQAEFEALQDNLAGKESEIASLNQLIAQQLEQIAALESDLTAALAEAQSKGYDLGYSAGYDDGYNKREEDDQAAASALVWDGTSDTSWYGEGEGSTYNSSLNAYVIFTAKQLAGFSSLVSAGNDFANERIYLANDLIMSDLNNNFNFTPIGTFETPFAGTFNGQNHTINGLLVDNYVYDVDREGLFGYSANATISNVTVNSIINSKQQILDLSISSETEEALMSFVESDRWFVPSSTISFVQVESYSFSSGNYVAYLTFLENDIETLVKVNFVADEMTILTGDDLVSLLISSDVSIRKFSNLVSVSSTLSNFASNLSSELVFSIEGELQGIYYNLSTKKNVTSHYITASMTYLIVSKSSNGALNLILVEDKECVFNDIFDGTNYTSATRDQIINYYMFAHGFNVGDYIVPSEINTNATFSYLPLYSDLEVLNV